MRSATGACRFLIMWSPFTQLDQCSWAQTTQTQRQSADIPRLIVHPHIQKCLHALAHGRVMESRTTLILAKVGLDKVGLAKVGQNGQSRAQPTKVLSFGACLCLQHWKHLCSWSGQEILHLRALRCHSGRNPNDPSLQDNVLIPDNCFECKCHIVCTISLHSTTCSGLMSGGHILGQRQNSSRL